VAQQPITGPGLPRCAVSRSCGSATWASGQLAASYKTVINIYILLINGKGHMQYIESGLIKEKNCSQEIVQKLCELLIIHVTCWNAHFVFMLLPTSAHENGHSRRCF
jgi:hypothetical protein